MQIWKVGWRQDGRHLEDWPGSCAHQSSRNIFCSVFNSACSNPWKYKKQIHMEHLKFYQKIIKISSPICGRAGRRNQGVSGGGLIRNCYWAGFSARNVTICKCHKNNRKLCAANSLQLFKHYFRSKFLSPHISKCLPLALFNVTRVALYWL